MKKILINSTVLSNFSAVNSLPLLQELYQVVYVAQAVYEETQDGLEEGYHFLAGINEFIHPFHTNGWLHLVNLEGETELTLYQQMPPKLHRGEAVSLAIAKHRQWGFLTDDQAARKHGNSMGVKISGTLGVLILSVKRGLISHPQANTLLSKMIVLARYRSPVSSLDNFLK